MGLLKGIGGGLKGLFGSDFGSKASRAAAFMNDDYAAASNITSQMQQQKAERAKAEQQQQIIAATYESLVKMGIPEDQAVVMAQDPKVVAQMQAQIHGSRLQDRQFASGGGSVARPGADGSIENIYSAPRWDSDGNLYGAAQGNAAPERQIKGTKVVPYTAGGGYDVVDSVTGLPPNAQQGGGPAVGTVDGGYRFKGGNPADRNNWEPVARGGGGGNVTSNFLDGF